MKQTLGTRRLFPQLPPGKHIYIFTLFQTATPCFPPGPHYTRQKSTLTRTHANKTTTTKNKLRESLRKSNPIQSVCHSILQFTSAEAKRLCIIRCCLLNTVILIALVRVVGEYFQFQKSSYIIKRYSLPSPPPLLNPTPVSVLQLKH